MSTAQPQPTQESLDRGLDSQQIVDSSSVVSPPRNRFLSEADCHDLVQRLAHYGNGGGDTTVMLLSRWTGNIRWARNRITTSGDDRDNLIRIERTVQGASNFAAITINDISDSELVAALRRAERVLHFNSERVNTDVISRSDSPFRPQDEPVATPQLFFDSTYNLDEAHRAELARQFMQPAAAAGMLSAGYLEVTATSMAHLTSWGYTKFVQYTWSQCSMTVRDPKGVGSGWAGVDWPDWNRVDGAKLAAAAVEKCLASRNPVAIEPGRYTTILEPQAVSDFVGRFINVNPYDMLDRGFNEGNGGPLQKSKGAPDPLNAGMASYTSVIDALTGRGQRLPIGYARLGEKIIDERLSISVDPMDPELGFPPHENMIINPGWQWEDQVYHPATWIENGVLKHLSENRYYAFEMLGRPTGMSNGGAFRMSVAGATSSMEEMIATTKRGVLVTRFDDVDQEDEVAQLYRGFTRDGLWLIENGKISKPVKNLMFIESVLFALNNVEQVGVPQRVFHPTPVVAGKWWAFNTTMQPVIVPPLKIKDFSFTALSDAI